MSPKVPLELTTPLGKDKLVLERIEGTEAISELFHFVLDMRSADGALDFDAIVGEDVTVKLNAQSGTPRYIHGMVERFVQGNRSEGKFTYRAVIYPKLFLLGLSTDYRIFQEQTVPDIVKTLLTEHGVTDVKDALTGSYPTREYCVQYGETALEFVSRLLEEEGIFYFFTHEDGKHTLVLGDDSSAHPETSPAEVPALLGFPERQVEDTIASCGYEKQLVTGGSTVLDYNFETPANSLNSNAAGTASTGQFEGREHPGGFGVKDEGDRIAKLRAEAFELPSATLSGSSYARGFTAGHLFALAQYERADLNGSYVLQRVTHDATLESYDNTFEAFPQAVPFRPARRRRPPRVAGSHSAVVVGPSGEKIHTDKYGRVKVQFHWDTRGTSDEKSSCWMRVAQEWAGKGYGTFFLPRIGQEVLVSFLDGSIDRPIVTGCVYNAQEVVPYELPANQTRSVIKTQTEGEVHNEICLEDKQDAEQIWVQAAKDFTADVVNDRTWTVHHDSIETVTNDRTATIEEGNEKLVVSKGSRTVEVSEGDETLTVTKGARKVEVKAGDETHTVEGKRTLSVTGDEERSSAKLDWNTSGNYTLKVDGNIVIEATGSITLKAGSDVTVQATNNLTNKGMNVTNDASVGLTNKAGTTLSNEAGATLNSKSSGMHSVEASGILNVKSSAILNVQGTLVKIN